MNANPTPQTFRAIERAAILYTNEALGRGEAVSEPQLDAAMTAKFPAVDAWLVGWVSWKAVQDAWTPRTPEDFKARLADLERELARRDAPGPPQGSGPGANVHHEGA